VLLAFSPGWWFWVNFVFGAFLSWGFQSPRIVCAAFYLVSFTCRRYSPWRSVPLSLATLLAMFMTIGALHPDGDATAEGGYGCFTPLRHEAPPGCSEVAAHVLAARDYFQARRLQASALCARALADFEHARRNPT
jgi:hypothetical protein